MSYDNGRGWLLLLFGFEMPCSFFVALTHKMGKLGSLMLSAEKDTNENSCTVAQGKVRNSLQ
jgi:hypothetical protein